MGILVNSEHVRSPCSSICSSPSGLSLLHHYHNKAALISLHPCSLPFSSSPLPHRSTLPALICVRRGCLVGLVVTRGGRHRVSLFCQRASPSLKLLQWRLARRRPRWNRLSHRLNLQPLRLPHQRCLARSSRKLLPRSIETKSCSASSPCNLRNFHRSRSI